MLEGIVCIVAGFVSGWIMKGLFIGKSPDLALNAYVTGYQDGALKGIPEPGSSIEIPPEYC